MSDATVLPLPVLTSDFLDAQSAGVGDTNGDGRMDVVVFATGYYFGPEQRLVIYEQQVDGTMSMVKQITLGSAGVYAYTSRGGAVGDLDGDGKAELLLAGAGANIGKLMVLGRGATGEYAPVAALPCPLTMEQVHTRDLNGDGLVDILVQDGARGYAIFFGKGAMAFSKPLYVLGFPATAALFADVDNDGVDDLVSTHHITDGGFGVNFGLTSPGMPAAGIYDYTEPQFFDWLPDSTPASAAYGRFPGSGQPSLALWYEEREQLTANTVTFHQTIRTVTFPDRQHAAVTATYRYQTGISRNSPPIQAADIDGDGDDDIVVFDGKHVEILLQQDGGFAPAYVVPDTTSMAGNFPAAQTNVAIADFNGDGCDDIGYMEGSFLIHYRMDCPLSARATSRRRLAPPSALPSGAHSRRASAR